MKKITVLLFTCLMLVALVACASNNENSDVSQSTTEPITEITSTEPTTKAKPELTAQEAANSFNKAYTEAKIWLTFYNDYWDRSDFFTGDNEYDFYYRINHETINSKGALKKHLSGYFSEALIDSLIEGVYVEKDGKLYHHCFVAGDAMPTNILDETKAELVSEGEDRVSFNITLKSDFSNMVSADEDPYRYNTESVDFVYENGRWVIDNYFKVNLYPPYKWNGTEG
ncbi:MAG: hypothetical protein IJ349_04885 [Clostridia bacterium]|nr:hypothetical protein [Clostridia bacterium]